MQFTLNGGGDASSPSTPEEIWTQLAPHLEAAMDKLSQRDRALLVLRFYENKSGPEAAALLGIREDAAHKRVTRAIEKLRKVFAQRGVTLSGAAIAGAVSANSVQAAPTGLAVAVTAATTKGAIVSATITMLVKGTLKVMTFSKLKLGIGFTTAILIAGGVIVYPILPSSGLADQDVQTRFETSLKNARTITNVEIQMLDTLWINDPAALKALNVNMYSRTFQYSYLASGQKFRAECKLISASQTNITQLEEAAFDGTTFFTYDSNQRYLTRQTGNSSGDNSEDTTCPLIAPFMFLTKQTDGSIARVLRFTDILSPAFTDGLILPAAKSSDGLLEIDRPGLSRMKQPTLWKIFLDPKGDSFTPKTIRIVGAGSETVYELLDYTNLGAYQFPSVIAWSSTKYLATSPATLQSTGMVTMISVSIPEQIPDSTFQFDEKSAATIWDWDTKSFVKTIPHSTKSRVETKTTGNVLASPSISVQSRIKPERASSHKGMWLSAVLIILVILTIFGFVKKMRH